MYYFLLKNSFKNIKKIFVQFFCITLILAFGVAFLTVTTTSEAHFLATFNKYQNQTNLHQMLLSPADNDSKYKPGSIYDAFHYDQNNSLIQDVAKFIPGTFCMNSNPSGNDTYRCTQDIFTYLQATSRYNFQYLQTSTIEESGVVNNQTFVNIASTFNDQGIDIPFYQIDSFQNIEANSISHGEVIVNKEWANNHHKNIGDTITAFGNVWKIQNFGISPTNLTTNGASFAKPSNAYAYLIFNKHDYELIQDTKNYFQSFSYVARFNDKLSINQLHNKITQLKNVLGNAIIVNPTNNFSDTSISSNPSSILVLESWSGNGMNGEGSIYTTFILMRNNKLISQILLGIILAYTLVIIYTVSKRQVNNSSAIIGTLKAIGYRRKEIAISMSLMVLLACLFGILAGYVIGSFLQIFMYNSLHIAYPSSKIFFEPFLFFTSLIFILLFVYLPSLLFLNIFIKKTAHEILIKKTDNKPNIISKLVSKTTTNLTFNFKFPMINASKSLAKILLVIITVNITTIFALFSLVTSLTIHNFSNKIYDSIAYNYTYDFKINWENLMNPDTQSDYYTTEINDPTIKSLTYDTFTSYLTQYVADSSDPASFQFKVNKCYLNVDTEAAHNLITFVNNISLDKWNLFADGLTLKNSIDKYCNQILSSKNNNERLYFGINVYDSDKEIAIHTLNNLPNSSDKMPNTLSMLLKDDDIAKYKTNISESDLEKLQNFEPENDEIPILVSSFWAKLNKAKLSDIVTVASIPNIGINIQGKILGIYDDNVDLTIFTNEIKMPSQIQPILRKLPKTSIYSKLDNFTYPELYTSISINNYNNVLESYISMKEIKQVISGSINQLNSIIVVFIIISTLWNVIIIALIASLIIQEYAFFISIMKILGYSTRKLANLFAQIFILPILLGYFLAIPIEYLMLAKISNLFNEKTPFNFSFNLNIWQLFIVFITIILIAVIAYLLTYIWIRKIYYLKLTTSNN